MNFANGRVTNFADRLISGRRPGLLLGAILLLIPLAGFADQLQRQVEVKVRFVEVSKRAASELGVDLLAGKLNGLSPDATKLISSGNDNLALGKTSTTEVKTRFFPENFAPGSLNLTGLLTDEQLQAVTDALTRKNVAEIISAPTLVIPNNQPAIINVTPEYGGLNLQVMPVISADGRTISLTITPEVADKPQTPSKITVGSPDRIPGLCDIPLLGGLFKSRKGGDKEEHLMIFVTPRLVNVLEGEDSGSGGGGGDTVDVRITGTGETIGHIADLKVRNLTDDPQNFIIPPLVLESRSQKNQDYVCPGQQEVALKPDEAKTLPMDGVCCNRDKPPVGKDVKDDLVINTGNPTVPTDCHNSPKETRDLIRYTEAKYRCVDQLQKDGELKNFPYADKKEQKEILVQWSVWNDPRICETTGAPPATKDDLEQVVYKQAEKKGSVPRDKKKKLDEGIDTIFDKVELTNDKAKDLEQPDPFAGVELTGDKAKGNQPSNSPNETSPVSPP